MTRERKEAFLIWQTVFIAAIAFWPLSSSWALKVAVLGLLLTGSELLLNRFQRDWRPPVLAKFLTGALIGVVVGLVVYRSLLDWIGAPDSLLMGAAFAAVTATVVAGLQPQDRRSSSGSSPRR